MSRVSRLAVIAGFVLLAGFAVVYFGWFPYHPSGPPMADFSAYYAAGHAWLHGVDPYGTGVWNVERSLPGALPNRRAMLPYVGPPLGLPLWAALAHLPYVTAVVIWGIAVFAAAVVIVVFPTAVAGALRRRNALPLFLLGLVCAPLVVAISAGQASLPAIAAVDVALACAMARRWRLATLALVAATALKPNDALVAVGIARDAAGVVALVVGAGASLLANTAAVGGFGALHGYIDVLAQHTASERLFALQLTPTSIAYGLGLAPDLALTVGTAISVATLIALVAVVKRAHASLIDATALASAAFPFIVPFEHEADFAILLLPALLVVFRARGWNWALGAGGLVLLCINPFGLALGPYGWAFTVVTALVAALQVAALAPQVPLRARLAPLLVVPIVVILGGIAPDTRLPMWPDALPAHVAIAPHASASMEWHDELVAAGLEAPMPWASVVRLLTLCGCAGVGIAMARTAMPSEREATRRSHVVQVV